MSETNCVLRGQIYHINGDRSCLPVGSEMWPDRPAVIVSNDINNQYSRTVEVVYLTSKCRRKYSPTHIQVRGNTHPSLALCEQIHSVDKSRLGDLLGTLSQDEIEEIDGALQISLGIPPRSNSVANLFKKWEYGINRYDLDNRMSSQGGCDIALLQRRIAVLTCERDSYKALYEAAQL